MGTTRSTLAALTGGGFEYRLILLLEGIPCAITNGSTTAAAAALSGTDWTQVLSGLVVQNWGKGQEIRPWSPTLSIPGITVGIQPDVPNDTFGKLAFNTSGGTETKLATGIDVNDNSVVVLRTIDFPASGEIHIGTECLAYSSKNDGTKTFTISKRGKYNPFRGTGLGRVHPIATGADHITQPPAVTSQPRVWMGRRCVLLMHRVVGGVWDTLAEAQILFAGRISGAPRDDERGWTFLDIEDIRADIRDCVLLRHQYSATVQDGMWLGAGMYFAATSSNAGAWLSANPLKVVAASPGTNEILEGYYTHYEICEALTNWLQDEKNASRLHYASSFDLVYADGVPRTRIAANAASEASRLVSFSLPDDVWTFLGWPGAPLQEYRHFEFADELQALSPDVPYRVYLPIDIDLGWGNAPSATAQVPVSNEAGTFFPNEDYLPIEIGQFVGETNVGLFSVEGGGMFLAVKTGSTLRPLPSREAHRYLNRAPLSSLLRVRMDSSNEITVRQVGVISGRLTSLVMWLLTSTGVTDYNGAFDELPYQLGAGIPWEVFGDTFETDLRALDAASADSLVVLEKPTRLWDVLAPEFLSRAANIIWKGNGGDGYGSGGIGGLRVVRWSTPTTATGLHNLTEASKAEPANVRDAQRTPTKEDDATVRNIVKVDHNRSLKGSGDAYEATTQVADVANMEEVGARTLTIKARNTFSDLASGEVDTLISEIAGWLPIFGRPMRLVERSINLSQFLEIAPGDHVTVSDNHVRSPATGERGIAGWPGLVLSVRTDWGGPTADGQKRTPVGEVQILLWPRNRFAPYSACAQVDDTAGGSGYNAGTKTITCYAHKHSGALQAADATRFPAGAAFTVVELDPANPAAPLSWSRNVVTQTGNTIVHDGVALGSGGGESAFDTTKKYRVISQPYGSASATQKLDVYQADDADGLIVDLAQAYELALNMPSHEYAVEDPADVRIALHAELAYGDGKPYDCGYHGKDLCQILNNLVSHATAPSIPSLTTKVETQTAACVWAIKRIVQVVMHPGELATGARYHFVQPVFRSATGASVSVRVSLCRGFPQGTSLVMTDADAPEYRLVGPYESHTWTTSSTTWQTGAVHAFSFASLDREGEGYLVIETTQNAELRGEGRARAGAYLEAA